MTATTTSVNTTAGVKTFEDMNGSKCVFGQITLTNDYVTSTSVNLANYIGGTGVAIYVMGSFIDSNTDTTLAYDVCFGLGTNAAACPIVIRHTNNGAVAADNTDLSASEVVFWATGKKV